MIARIWHGSTSGDAADRYLEHLRRNVMPQLGSIDGYRGIQVLHRPRGDTVAFIIVTFWESMDAIHAFAGPDAEVAVVAPEAQAMLTAYDLHAVHYEVAIRT
jgi:heme-degrading monooxygenase HmoA